jgi:hypothetical protein
LWPEATDLAIAYHRGVATSLPGPVTLPDLRVIRPFPSHDLAFADAVREAGRLVLTCPPDEVEERLADALRDVYPAIVVRRISVLGSDGEGRLIWYAFREGRAAG